VFVLVICVLVFTVFCIVCTVFLCCFFYGYVFLLVSSVMPTSDNSVAVNNNNDNNNKFNFKISGLEMFSWVSSRSLKNATSRNMTDLRLMKDS
jgi:hypothetical protein